MITFFLILALTVQAAPLARLRLQRAQRAPLQKRKLTFRSPTKYEKRILRYDPKTGNTVYYDPKPEVILLDQKSGKYGLKWTGYAGKAKIVVFKRAHALDAIVAASTSRTASRPYVYIS